MAQFLWETFSLSRFMKIAQQIFGLQNLPNVLNTCAAFFCFERKIEGKGNVNLLLKTLFLRIDLSTNFNFVHFFNLAVQETSALPSSVHPNHDPCSWCKESNSLLPLYRRACQADVGETVNALT